MLPLRISGCSTAAAWCPTEPGRNPADAGGRGGTANLDAIERLNRRLLLAALLLAVLAAFAVHAYLTAAARRALRPHTVPVVVARQAIPAHTALTAGMLTVAQYTPGIRPSGALSSAAKLAGDITQAPLAKGEPVLPQDLSRASAPSSLSYAIRPGMRAMTLPVNLASGVAELIRPGDRVDVLVVFRPPTSAGVPVVDTLEQDVKVLAVGQHLVGQSGKQPTSYTSVTLEVSPLAAERLAFASSHGSIQLTLRSVTDRTHVAITPVNGSGIPGA